MSMISMRAQLAAAWTLSMVARSASRVLSVLPMGDRAERFLLERTWSSGSAAMLDRYLVAGYQNPRLNLQSIALRHVLVSRLFGAEFESIMDEEIRFAIGLNESLRARAAELGVKMGSYRNPIKQAAVRRVDAAIADRQMQLVDGWRSTLEGRSIEPLAVLELACGSANDYRAFAESGLARHLDYIGVDLSAKNVANARRRFPGATFEVGNILELPYPDGAFDEVIASDIFEHLSPEAMEAALQEAMRLARHGLILTFFNMADAPDHEIQRRRAYHWNRLSRPRIEARLRESFASVSAIPIARLLRDRYGYAHSYNRHAWTILARRAAPADLPEAWKSRVRSS